MNDPALRIASAITWLSVPPTERASRLSNAELNNLLTIALRDWRRDLIEDVSQIVKSVVQSDCSRDHVPPPPSKSWSCTCGWMNPTFAPCCENTECGRDHP